MAIRVSPYINLEASFIRSTEFMYAIWNFTGPITKNAVLLTVIPVSK